jgi:EmrB/QacA subfamily drug resistance transporter
VPTSVAAPPLQDAAPSGAQTVAEGARRRWLGLIVVGLGTISSLLVSTSFTIAVPALSAHFGIGPAQVQWTLTGFLAAMTIGMLPTSWLLDRLGYRKLFLAAIAIMALAGVTGYFAENFALVVALRVAQGAAAGILQPLSMITVMRRFPANERGRASGVLGFGIVLAPVTAPTIAGFLLDRFGWHSLFLVNLIPCAIAAVLGAMLLPDLRSAERRNFDWIGLALLAIFTLGVVGAVVALRQGSLLSVTGLVGFALLALAGFLLHARRAKHPIIGLGPFADKTFAFGIAVTFAYGFGLYGSSYLIPVFLQNAQYFSAGDAGAATLPAGVVLPFTILLAGRMTDHYKPLHITMGGLAMFGLSALMFGALALHFSYPGVIAASVFARIGLGFILPALSVASMVHLTREQVGQGSVVVSYARQMGATLGIAAPAVFESWRQEALKGAPDGIAHAYAQSFLMVAAVFGLALIATTRMRAAPRRRD